MDDLTVCRLISEQQLRKQFHKALSRYRFNCELADVIGVSRQYLSMVKRGSKPVNGKIAAWLGFERVVTYRRKP